MVAPKIVQARFIAILIVGAAASGGGYEPGTYRQLGPSIATTEARGPLRIDHLWSGVLLDNTKTRRNDFFDSCWCWETDNENATTTQTTAIQLSASTTSAIAVFTGVNDGSDGKDDLASGIGNKMRTHKTLRVNAHGADL